MSVAPAAALPDAAPHAERAVVVAAAAAMSGLAWLWLAGATNAMEGRPAMLAPHHHVHDAPSFILVVAMWQAMMIAMMTPAVLRWVLTFATLTSGHGRSARAGTLAAFAAGYFAVWLAYSIAAAAIQDLAARLAMGDAMIGVAAPLGGAILLAAGLLQFAPFKQACLKHCRNPLGYLLARWHDGPPRPFHVGVAHGAYCVGCCWALMATAFAAGVMNLAWMAVLTVAMAVEQIAPGGDRAGRAVGVALAAWGVVLIVLGIRD